MKGENNQWRILSYSFGRVQDVESVYTYVFALAKLHKLNSFIRHIFLIMPPVTISFPKLEYFARQKELWLQLQTIRIILKFSKKARYVERDVCSKNTM